MNQATPEDEAIYKRIANNYHAKMVKLPTDADEAAAMVLVGMSWLKEHAPDRLKPEHKCPGIPAPKCDYLAECNSVCNKCGQLHRPQLIPVAQDPWKSAVIEALVVSHVYQKAHEDDPQKALAALIQWETQTALDPQVSSQAQALIEQGRKEAEERCTMPVQYLQVDGKGPIYAVYGSSSWNCVQAILDRYEELIKAVGNKYEGESRHQTALRYIKQAENQVSTPKELPGA